MKNTDQHLHQLIHTHKHEKMSELNIWLKIFRQMCHENNCFNSDVTYLSYLGNIIY